MYSDVMHRTQIYLDDEELALIAQESRRSGASRSELIRRAIRRQYGGQAAEDRLAALQAAAGMWQERTTTGVDYVDSIRGDLNERMTEVGLG